MVTTTDMTAAAIAVTKNVAATGPATDEAEENKNGGKIHEGKV